jgi:hypothetical protein
LSGVTDQELTAILKDLLTIAQIAMPEYLFAIDPRVQKAKAGLDGLRKDSGRVPSIGGRQETMPHIGSADPADPLAEQIFAALNQTPLPHWDITEALDGFMASEEAPATRQSAVELILREWLTSNGYMPLMPAKEDAD